MTLDTAMIFAAGFGTRMGSLTHSTPKPMLPLCGRPMVDHAIDSLHEAGFKRLFANTHYLADQIAPHLGSRGVTVCHEEKILETGGGLKAAMPEINRDVIVTVNPDAVWLGENPIDFLVRNWKPHMEALLLLVPLSKAHCTGPKGDFALTEGRLKRDGPYRYTGLQILNLGTLKNITQDVFSLNLYWDKLLEKDGAYGVVYPHDWCDLGTPEGLAWAERRLST